MKVLFITRKSGDYSIGGMEKLSDKLIKSVSELPDIRVQAIVWKHSQKLLPLFALIAFLRACIICLQGIDVIHIGDVLLSPLGIVLKILFGTSIVVTAHGLDLVFPNYFYQKLVSYFLRRYDKVICISRATYQHCLERGIPPRRCLVIYPGVDLPQAQMTQSASQRFMLERWGIDPNQLNVLMTVGRLVPRKGVYFFVQAVLPSLVQKDPSFFYIIVGEGPDRRRVQKAIREQGLEAHVLLTGYLDDQSVSQLYPACNLVVVPNIPRTDDIEGFGLVVLEAEAAGCAVLVSDLEGLRDTVPVDRQDWLIPAEDMFPWSNTVLKLFEQKDQLERRGMEARIYVAQHFNWSRVSRQYLDVFAECIEHEHS